MKSLPGVESYNARRLGGVDWSPIPFLWLAYPLGTMIQLVLSPHLPGTIVEKGGSAVPDALLPQIDL